MFGGHAWENITEIMSTIVSKMHVKIIARIIRWNQTYNHFWYDPMRAPIDPFQNPPKKVDKISNRSLGQLNIIAKYPIEMSFVHFSNLSILLW